MDRVGQGSKWYTNIPEFPLKIMQNTKIWKNTVYLIPIKAGGGGGGGGDMKGTWMLVVSLRGVNFGFWSRLGCSGKMSLFLAVKVSFRVAHEEITKKKEF